MIGPLLAVGATLLLAILGAAWRLSATLALHGAKLDLHSAESSRRLGSLESKVDDLCERVGKVEVLAAVPSSRR